MQLTGKYDWWLIGGAVVAAPLIGTVTAVDPMMGFVGVVAVSSVSLALCVARRLPMVFLIALGVCLFGYSFFGKGFAYLGASPLYVGELVLLLGLAAALVGGGIGPAFRSPVIWALLAFCAWGVVRTVPYLGTYKLEALRDAIVWGYGVYALLVAGFVLRLRCWNAVVDAYGRYFWWFGFWAPVAAAIFRLAEASIPRVPGSGGDIPLLFVKAGDYGVQLAGIGTFVLLGLGERGRATPRVWLEWLWWGAWLTGLAIVGAASRGALLCVFVAMGTVLVFRPTTRWWKPALVSAAFVAVFVSTNVTIDAGQDRQVSARQIITNVRSIAGGESNESNLDGTRAWRLQWWNDIIGYTIRGPLFWTGRGFGENLADADGYQGTDRGIPNRHPHNIQMTVLAHAGVPGLALWVALQLLFAGSLVVAYFKARRAALDWWARVDLWILSFWLAFMLNAAFDVFIEGPQGGIWFWSLIGLGVAVLEAQRRGMHVTAVPAARVAHRS